MHGRAAGTAGTSISFSMAGCGVARCGAAMIGQPSPTIIGEAVDLADCKAKKAEVDARRASAGREPVRLAAEQRITEQTEIETQFLIDDCTRVRQALQHCTPEDKRRAIAALNITVVWHPNKPLAVQGNIPIEM